MYVVLFCNNQQFLLVENQVAYGLVSKQGILHTPTTIRKGKTIINQRIEWYLISKQTHLLSEIFCSYSQICGRESDSTQHKKKRFNRVAPLFRPKKMGRCSPWRPCLADGRRGSCAAKYLRSAGSRHRLGLTVPSPCASRLSCVCLFISGFWHSKSRKIPAKLVYKLDESCYLEMDLWQLCQYIHRCGFIEQFIT